MIPRVIALWQALAPRERRLVRGAGAVVLFALAWVLAVEPAWKARVRLGTELPRAQAQLAQLEALAVEARQLASVPGSNASAQSQRAALQTSIAAAGLGGQLAQSSLSGDLFDLRFKAVAFDAWLAWLESVLRETRLRVVDLELQREPQAGLVSVRLVLERPRGADQ
jgi:general secretion pathway protein M